MKGFAGKISRVNFSKNMIKVEKLLTRWLRKVLGRMSFAHVLFPRVRAHLTDITEELGA